MTDTSTETEKVLCLARKDIPPAFLSCMGHMAISDREFFSQLNFCPLHYLPRQEAEFNEGFKQLIPYAVIQTKDHRTAFYKRNGNEKRLVDLWSVGIGGHITLEDRKTSEDTLEEILKTGLNREIQEETGLVPTSMSPEFMGIINEEVTSAGRVHLGLLYRLVVSDNKMLRPSKELSQFQFVPVSRIKDFKLEHWSEFSLELILKYDRVENLCHGKKKST